MVVSATPATLAEVAATVRKLCPLKCEPSTPATVSKLHCLHEHVAAQRLEGLVSKEWAW